MFHLGRKEKLAQRSYGKPPWLIVFTKTGNGVTVPATSVAVYTHDEVCKPHDCPPNDFHVLLRCSAVPHPNSTDRNRRSSAPSPMNKGLGNRCSPPNPSCRKRSSPARMCGWSQCGQTKGVTSRGRLAKVAASRSIPVSTSLPVCGQRNFTKKSELRVGGISKL
jgi:hypothetical protein